MRNLSDVYFDSLHNKISNMISIPTLQHISYSMSMHLTVYARACKTIL